MHIKRGWILLPFAIVLLLASSPAHATAGTWVRPPANGPVVLATAGGQHGSLPVCRGNYDNGQQPGKLWDGTCNIAWGGRTIYVTDSELLPAGAETKQFSSDSILPAPGLTTAPVMTPPSVSAPSLAGAR